MRYPLVFYRPFTFIFAKIDLILTLEALYSQKIQKGRKMLKSRHKVIERRKKR